MADPEYIRVRDIACAAQVRSSAGRALGRPRKPVTRRTILLWRATKGFPDPVTVLKSGKAEIELWDIREVRAWLREYAAKRDPR